MTESERIGLIRKRNVKTIVMETGGRCQRCGIGDLRVLEFHHRNPQPGDERVGRIATGLERARREASKCDLLCANCHLIAHSELRS